VLHPLLALVAPRSCAGCLRPDVWLCRRCYERLQAPIESPSLAVATALRGVPVMSGGSYRGARRRVVAAVKDGGVRTLSAALVSPAMVRALSALRPTHTGLVLVPVPPSARGFFLRGFWPTVVIARTLSQRAGGFPVCRAMSVVGPVLNLRALWAPRAHRDRAERLQRRWSQIRVRGLAPHSRVVLVDDVMVTGSTLEACARALRRRGHSIVAVFVAAHAPEPYRAPFRRSGGQV